MGLGATLLWAGGHPGGAIMWLMVGVLGPALWLGFGFVLMRVVALRSGISGEVAWRDIGRAWLGEVGASTRVFQWRQPWRSAAVQDVWPEVGKLRPGALLVHGYLCNRGFWNPWLRQMSERGFSVAAVNLEPIWAGLDEYAATLEAAYVRWEESGEPAPWLVAHSMGGLVVRAWLRSRPEPPRIAGVVTLGTPHHGTWLASWGHAINVRQMRPHSAWLRRLEEDERQGLGLGAFTPSQVLCVYSPCDSIVFPSPLAQDERWPSWCVHASGHVALAEQPEVLQRVMEQIERMEHRMPVERG